MADYDTLKTELEKEAGRPLTEPEQAALSGYVREPPESRSYKSLQALRERLGPATKEAPAPPAAPPRVPPPTTTPPAEPVKSTLAALQGEATEARGRATALLPEVEQARASFVKTAQTPPPTFTGTITLPELPAGPRAFLSMDGGQTIGQLVSTLGLLAVMGAGGGAPRASLAALRGAVTGWNAREHDRAEQQWQRFGQLVKLTQWRTQLARQAYEDAVTRHRGNQEAAKVAYTTTLDKFGLAEQAANAARRDFTDEETRLFRHEQAADAAALRWQALQNTKELIELRREQLEKGKSKTPKTVEDYNAILTDPASTPEQRTQAEAGLRGLEAVKTRIAAAGAGAGAQAREAVKAGLKAEDRARISTTTLVGINQVLSFLPKLAAKGLLMRQPGASEYARVWYQQHVAQIGDPDLVAYRSHTSTLVRTARELGDIGFRAQAAIQGTLAIIENPTTPEGVRTALEQLKTLITAQIDPSKRRTFRAYDTQANQPVSVTLDPGETFDGFLEAHPDIDASRVN